MGSDFSGQQLLRGLCPGLDLQLTRSLAQRVAPHTHHVISVRLITLNSALRIAGAAWLAGRLAS